MRHVHAVAVAVLAGTLIAGVGARQSQAPASDGVVERPFPAGGQVTLDLSAGQYSVIGTDQAKVVARWHVSDPSKAREVSVTAQTAGNQARVDIDGPHNNFRAEIEVPARSDVWVSLSAGDLTTRGLQGSQDISAWAGKIVLGVLKPEAYRSVTASVTAGEIKAAAFDLHKGGLFRSIAREGTGPHTLRVRLTAGEVILEHQADKKPAPPSD
jgi:phage baseplate assembly protein gpV